MPRLSELVAVRNELQEAIVRLPLTNVLGDKKRVLEDFCSKHNNVYKKQLDTIIGRYNDLETVNRTITSETKNIIKNMNKEIHEYASEFTEKSGNDFSYQEAIIPKKYDLLSVINDELKSIIRSRIARYTDWHYPGLIIDPFTKGIVDLAVTADPLYIASHNKELMTSIIQGFPKKYQTRVRDYVIEDLNFKNLPQHQFSFILIWDIFNFCKLSVIEETIKKTFNLIRPGGVILFNYCNIDNLEMANRVQYGYHPYASKEMIENLSKSLKYELVELDDFETSYEHEPTLSLAAIKKPGNLTTVKAHQVIGEVPLKAKQKNKLI